MNKPAVTTGILSGETGLSDSGATTVEAWGDTLKVQVARRPRNLTTRNFVSPLTSLLIGTIMSLNDLFLPSRRQEINTINQFVIFGEEMEESTEAEQLLIVWPHRETFFFSPEIPLPILPARQPFVPPNLLEVFDLEE